VNVTWSVERGRVKINDIAVVVDHDDCRIFEIDCATKYAEVLSDGESDDGFLVMLDTTERSQNADESKTGPTVVYFQVPAGTDLTRWRLLAECVRYTAQIVLYRPTYGETEP
jgi:hypothetical protein